MTERDNSFVLRWCHAGALLSLAVSTSACAILRAGSAPTVPPLEVPDAPPRVVAEFPTEAPTPEIPSVPVADVVETPALTPEAPVRTTRAPEASADPDETASEAPTADPAPPLQLRPSPDETINIRTVRGSLARTASVLTGIDRATLSPARRVQYDTARRFLNQATEAIAVDNVTFAHYLGQKAETLASSLQAP